MESLPDVSASTALGAESDESLLLFMALKTEDADLAREAWTEFYARHAGFLFAAAKKLWADTFGEGVVADIVQQTFMKVYDKAETFDSARLSGDAAQRRRQVRAWLCTIAHHELIDTIRAIPMTVPFLCDPETNAEDVPLEKKGKWWEPDEGFKETSTRIKLIEKGLGQLSEKEQDILRLTAAWYVPGQQLRIPSEDLQKLATALQTTPESIRQTRKRALAKLRDYVESRECERSKTFL